MSWWLNLDRAEFSRELSERFYYNRPENARQAYRHHKPDAKAQASRGGKQKRTQYLSHAEMWARKQKKSA